MKLGIRILFSSMSLLLCIDTLLASSDSNWKEVKLGGNTKCIYGDEYSLFYSPGKENKLVVDFFGGGACWDAKSCRPGSKLMVTDMDDFRLRKKIGIYDRTNEANPYKDWTHVVVPYCTGDLHWGNAQHTYEYKDQKFKVYHNGAENVKAVIKWLEKNIKFPEHIQVTGCSAGSYASIYWTPHIKEVFRFSNITQFGDSGAGVLTQDFLEKKFISWNAEENAAYWIPKIDPAQLNWTALSLSHLYEAVADYYPDIKFAQYNSQSDYTQIAFYALMGGNPLSWGKKMLEAQIEMSQVIKEYSFFVNRDVSHCAYITDGFYKRAINGVKVKDWLSRFINGLNVNNHAP